MNRAVASILYILGATAVNVAVMVGLLLLLSLTAGLLLPPNPEPKVQTLVFVGIVSLSLAGTYLLYQRLVKWLESRYQISRFLKRGEDQ